MADKIEIREEGDPEINELKRQVRVLEHQTQVLTRAVLLLHLGSEMGAKKHKRLLDAVNGGERILIELEMPKGATWPELLFQVQGE